VPPETVSRIISCGSAGLRMMIALPTTDEDIADVPAYP